MTMSDHGLRFQNDGRQFRHCVQNCARDERFVAVYNKLHGTQLKAPLSGLLDHKEGSPGPDPNTDEGAQLARFILFCHMTVWRHVRRAQQRTSWPIRLASELTDEPRSGAHDTLEAVDVEAQRECSTPVRKG
jgi:hypothetical protein